MSAPLVECDYVNPGLAVRDVPAAIDFYTNKLGFKLGFTWGGDPPTFAGVTLGNVQLFLGKGMPPPPSDVSAAFFHVGDADPLYEMHQSNGVEIVQTIADRSYGIRDYAIRDPWGHLIVFGHNLYNAGPPVKIERVDVPVRLEKRLAALLADLAQHKRMTIGSCLEEMILNTNEGVGPHTKTTLRYIEELKKEHGIDYDCHAS
ncbi:MAG: VOC family protein [Acidobacteriia bacterium]|nr:VOC family protein [Terriglobia bacterium]